LSTYDIAKKLGIGRTTIYNKLIEYSIKTRPKKIVNINKDNLNKLYYKRKLPLSKIAVRYKCCNATILKKMKSYGLKRRDMYESNRRYLRKKFSGDLMEKAYLIGFRLGDLNAKALSDKTITLKSNTTRLEQVRLIKNIFGRYGHVYIKESKDIYHTQCFLDESFNFLLKKEDNIKDWILNDSILFFAFLGGYSDAEGSIGIYNNMARYRVGSYDKNLLYKVYKKLNRLGIKASYILEMKMGIYNNIKYNDNFWRVNVNKKEDLLNLFINLKPFIKHPKRYKDLLKAEDNITRRINKNEKILCNNPNLLCK